jgi:hypothetical protein
MRALAGEARSLDHDWALGQIVFELPEHRA